MKKLLLVAFVACMTVFATSCSKEKELAGTTWTYTISETETGEIEGMPMEITVNGTVTLQFVDQSNGKLTMEMSLIMGGMNLGSQSETQEFTYTFDGTNGTMTAEGVSQNFTYNKEDNTITLTETGVDEETGETITETMVFNEVK